ncbi:MAG: LysE family transporter [Gillisia sp.]
MDDTKLFLITFSAAFLGVLPPGLVNMTVAKTCVDNGRKNGLYVALGATMIVFCQATIAVFLARYIFSNPYIKNMLLRAGLVIFAILAVYFFVKARQDSKVDMQSQKSNRHSIFKGMFIAVLNVFPIPYFTAIAAAQNIGDKNGYHLIAAGLFVIAASLGTFCSLYLYVVSFLKIENKTHFFTRYSNYFMAGLMLVLVIITVLRIFYT